LWRGKLTLENDLVSILRREVRILGHRLEIVGVLHIDHAALYGSTCIESNIHNKWRRFSWKRRKFPFRSPSEGISGIGVGRVLSML